MTILNSITVLDNYALFIINKYTQIESSCLLYIFCSDFEENSAEFGFKYGQMC